jgi:rubredoxin
MSQSKQRETNVELHLAFFWVCPECGVDNFDRGIRPELTKEEAQATRAELGIEVWEEGVLFTRPDFVSCSSCKFKFETSDPENDIEDEGFEYQ